ncbi:hypothetical protein [Streptomyces sp. NPDC045470]
MPRSAMLTLTRIEAHADVVQTLSTVSHSQHERAARPRTGKTRGT